ncbi:MAG: malto-oligosyltrehalose synthase, partial [Betaproteobacteria bacterium]
MSKTRVGRGTGSVKRRRDKDAPLRPLHLPLATYRIQLNADFTFSEATALIPYLAALGISHVYCSPYQRARPGSMHGYDIVEHGALNPEIGTRADFDRFVATLADHRMGHLCDVVPNHVGVMGADNAWWMDVLENGPASACAEYFDIEWAPFDSDLAGRVLVPVLGDSYGAVLERGELQLVFEPDAGAFSVWYFGHRFPIDPREFPVLLNQALHNASELLRPDVRSAASALVASLSALPPRTVAAAAAVNTRQRGCALGKAELARLTAASPALAEAIGAAVSDLNGVVGQPGSFERLHALLEAQAYRLAFWRVASDEINYRRFFDINDLAALRMENAEVFHATHDFVLGLAATGAIHGLRIDHPDGLYDPGQYFNRLQRRYGELIDANETSRMAFDSAPASNSSPSLRPPRPPLYVVLEKIAASYERMPAAWPVSGTTGYRFANLVNGLFVNGAAKTRLDRSWRAFVGDEALDFATIAYRGKLAIMRGALAAELTMVANRALRLARADRRTRDFTFNVLRGAIEEVVAHFPVYRTYVTEEGASTEDHRYVDWAITRARRGALAVDASVYEFLRA